MWEWANDTADNQTFVDDLAKLDEHAVGGILDVDSMTAITKDGVMVLTPRPHPGGWAEFGDDGDDAEEREGRS